MLDIERINEHTLKFYLSYEDIEERGYSKDDVWYNREKSEELFWNMMDEINDNTEFEVDGPLWIQVHAMKSGIEVIVTRAQKQDDEWESPFDEDSEMEEHFDAEISAKDLSSLSDLFHDKLFGSEEKEEKIVKAEGRMYRFKDIEDVIQLASKIIDYEAYLQAVLYSYDDRYYVYVNPTLLDNVTEDIYGILSEYGTRVKETKYVLDEYGTVVSSNEPFTTLLHYFK